MAIHKTKFIEVSKIDNEYHWKPFSPVYETARVPQYLFDEYVETRTKYEAMRGELETYFTPKKVNEGEVHKLNSPSQE